MSLDGVLDMKINGGGANTGKVMHALMVGKPVSAFYMLRQDGIYQTDQEVPSKLYAKEYVLVIVSTLTTTMTETSQTMTACM